MPRGPDFRFRCGTVPPGPEIDRPDIRRPRSAARREARLEAARRVIETGRRKRGWSLSSSAGIHSRTDGVDRVFVQKIVDILAGFGGLVYATPGNHDPFMPGSVWEHPAWRSNERVHVLREEIPIDVPGGTLFPCPLREQHSGKDPTMWIPGISRIVFLIELIRGVLSASQNAPEIPLYPACARLLSDFSGSGGGTGLQKESVCRQLRRASYWLAASSFEVQCLAVRMSIQSQ